MIIKTRGIIFRNLKYSETSLILDAFTEENGMQSFIVSGVRKKSAKASAGIYQAGNILDLIAYHKNSNSLNRIKEAKLAYTYQDIPFNVIKASVSMFIIDVSRNVIKEKNGNQNLFHFIYNCLVSLDQNKGSFANQHLTFMLELAQHLGFEFHNNYSDVFPYFNLENGAFVRSFIADQYHLEEDESILLYQLLNHNKAIINDWKINSVQRNHLLNVLLKFYKYHIEGFRDLKSIEILRTVLS